jgi:hypothetical protein
MISTKINKDKSVHGVYKSKDITLKILIENKKTLANIIKKKLEIFRETDDATFTQTFNFKHNYSLKLDKDSGKYSVSLTKNLDIQKENMDDIEKMILEMVDNINDTPETLVNSNISNSSTNLLLNSSTSLNSL